MESYKNVLKKRMIGELVLGIILIPLAVITFWGFMNAAPVIQGNNIKDFIGGFFNGVRGALVAGFAFYLFCQSYKDYKANKDADNRRKSYVEENDERQISISQMASKRASFITMYSLLVGTVVAGCFNGVISITLLLVWVYMAVVKIISTNVYNSRM